MTDQIGAAHQRLSTVYGLPLDRSTTDLLAGAPLGTIEDVGAIQFVKLDVKGSRLLYTVPYDRDNEYVHKALRRNLRTWINVQKALTAERTPTQPWMADRKHPLGGVSQQD